MSTDSPEKPFRQPTSFGLTSHTSPVRRAWDGVLGELAQDAGIADIIIRSTGDLCVKRHGRVARVPDDLLELHKLNVSESIFDFCQEYLGIDRKYMDEMRDSHEAAFRINKVRFRSSLARNVCGYDITLRRVPGTIPSVESIKFPRDAYEYFAAMPHGLVLVAGPTGSGKSTSMAALLRYRAEKVPGEIFITAEDPVEYEHPTTYQSGTIVHQRDVGACLSSFHSGAKSSMRQSPNVIMIGEIRDQESAAACIRLAETGHVVIGTVHAEDVPAVFKRLYSYTSDIAGMKESIAKAVEMVIVQRLEQKKDGSGMIPLHEIYMRGPSIMASLYAADYTAIPAYIKTNVTRGMQDFAESKRKRSAEGFL